MPHLKPSARGLGHLADDPGAVGHEQGLVVKDELLVLSEVLIVGLSRGDGVGVGGELLTMSKQVVAASLSQMPSV